MARGMGWQKHLFMIVGLTCAVLFMASSLILFAGMMPTIAANLLDKSRQKSRAISVGMMNFAGCVPFLLELWMSPSPNSIDTATAIIMQPETIIVIYVLATAGYALESAITGIVATMMQQHAQLRLREIDKQLSELSDRWNTYVDGSTLLDDYGFPARREDR